MPLAPRSAPAAKTNRLLAALPDLEWSDVEPFLVPVNLALGAPVYESGQHIEHVYFPVTAIISLLYP